jgi:hypothetical protein
MLFFLTDEDVRGAIIDGLRLHHPELDVVRAVEIGLGGMDDDVLLGWAAENGRVTVSHDVNTMIFAANRRLASGVAMSGLIVVPQSLSTAKAIADLAYVAEFATAAEMQNVTAWLPL